MAQGRHRRIDDSAGDGASGTEPAVADGRTAGRRVAGGWAIGVLAALAVITVIISSLRGGGAQSGASGSAASAIENRTAAAQWVRTNLPSQARVLAGADVDAELDRLGAPQQHAAVDGAGAGEISAGWRDYDYIVSSAGLRGSTDGTVAEAIGSSSPLASFGPEPSRIEVRRIEPAGPEMLQSRRESQAAAGAQLSRNPRLMLTAADRSLLSRGEVDPRLMVLLAAAADRHVLTIGALPARAGEEVGPRRTVVITSVDAQSPAGTGPAVALQSWLGAQEPPFAPASAEFTDGALVIGFDIAVEEPLDFRVDLAFAGVLPA